MNIVSHKTCKICREEKSSDEFYRQSATRDGLQTYCKSCSNAKRDEWAKENSDRLRQSRRVYCQENSAKLSQRSRQWAIANPDKFSEYQQEYAQRNSEKIRENKRRYNKKNPHKLHEITTRRRARKMNATIGKVSFQRILDRDGFTCYLCGLDVSSKDVSYDHVVPLARGGAHSEENIRVTHLKCNQKKGIKMLTELEWYVDG